MSRSVVARLRNEALLLNRKDARLDDKAVAKHRCVPKAAELATARPKRLEKSTFPGKELRRDKMDSRDIIYKKRKSSYHN
jgi:hypothetical protein